METEESISQEPYAYPGRSEERANTAYNLQPPTMENLANKYRNAKNTSKAGKKLYNTAKNARATIQAAQTAYMTAQATIAAAGAIIGGISAGTIIIIFIAVIIIIALLKTLNILGINTSRVEIAQTGPVQAKIFDQLNYTITVNYPNSEQNIIVFNQVPDGTKFISAPKGTYDYKTNTITWNLSTTTSSASSLTDNISTTLSLSLLATKDNNYIINIPKGKIINPVLGEKDSQLLSPQNANRINSITTPTIFQNNPAGAQFPQDINFVSNCVITKIGEPAITPSLPQECQ